MSDMRVRFWGVRGSIPVPGSSTLIYGGNTACVEVRCGERLVVLDAGSGLRSLGLSLIPAAEPVAIDLLLSHSHIDHLIGLPFFSPAFVPTAAITLWAGHLGPGERLERVLGQLMVPPLLPITPDTFKADITYRDFPVGDRLDLGGGILVTTIVLNHPGNATGYRIDYGGRAVCYMTDYEHAPGPIASEILNFVSGADLLIYDAMYTEAEYLPRQGWGHSTWREGARLAEAGRVGQLVLFHHAPERDDVALEQLERDAAAFRAGTVAAREGLEITLSVFAPGSTTG